MALTPKQEAFCVAYLKLGNASEAYRRVYRPTGKAETVWRSATALMDNPKVAARLQELRAKVEAKELLTLERHLRDLRRLRNGASKVGQFGPAVTAEVARGKAAGLQVEKSEHKTKVAVTIAVVDPYAKPGAP